MSPSEVAQWLPVNTGDADDVRSRRIRLGLSIKQLAEEAGVAEDTLGDGEAGRRELRPATWGKVNLALDRLEAEAGVNAPPRVVAEERIAGAPEKPVVRYKIGGNFGVSVVLEGPVENIAELEASAARLIAGMQQDQGEAQPG